MAGAAMRVLDRDGFAVAEATFGGLLGRLRSGDPARMSHSELEALLERESRELMGSCCGRIWTGGRERPPRPGR